MSFRESKTAEGDIGILTVPVRPNCGSLAQALAIRSRTLHN